MQQNKMKNRSNLIRLSLALTCLLVMSMLTPQSAEAQIESRWLTAGSVHNFYVSTGMEREHALVNSQQYGLRWPAIHPYQDTQAAKALWIGAKNFTDPQGNVFDPKVVHIGPRVSGAGNFYPIELKMVSKNEPTAVSVNGDLSFDVTVEIDAVDPSLPSDVMVYNKVNTSLGLTMERRIHQFSQQNHDNYHMTEYIFTNTGNTNADNNIELPSNTLQNVYFFFQWRYSVVRQTRYVIGNATGWGLNAMNDRFNDGTGRPNYGMDDSEARGFFTWHGRFPDFTAYDNVGGPIWIPNTVGGFMEASDSTGRLGAYHFVGNATLHADRSTTDSSDDPDQPRTMTNMESDDLLNFNNDAFNQNKMTAEYNFMSRGRTPRHAFQVESTGEAGFLSPSAAPNLGTSGGYSHAAGYGPYTIGPGESIRIVIAEGVSGISKELANETGRRFKRGDLSSLQKNQIVFQGRDSLMQTFRRAKDNFDSDFAITQAPNAPLSFDVNGGGDGIYMEWSYDAAAQANITGFEVYRAERRVDSTYYRIAALPPTAQEFVDNDLNPFGGPQRGQDYFYYLVAVGTPGADGVLKSNRFFTQTYDPARLQRPAGEYMSQIRIAPNPYTRRASAALSLGGNNEDRIAFFDVPGTARIRIYTELGELIKTINHTDGSGDAFWDLTTEWRQKIVSGIYIVLFKDLNTGETTTQKFVAIL